MAYLERAEPLRRGIARYGPAGGESGSFLGPDPISWRVLHDSLRGLAIGGANWNASCVPRK